MTRARVDQSVKINGPALRFVREAADLSIGHLARAADVSVSFLARVERGVKRGVRRQVFDVLVERLGLDDPRVILVDPYKDVEHNAQTVLQCRSTDRVA